MHTNTEGWYYGEPGGEIHGPLPMETIRTAISAGRLTETVSISHTANGPWAPLSVVSKLGEQAFDSSARKRVVAKTTSRAKPSGKSVAGFIEVIGYVIAGTGLLCLLGMLIAWKNQSPTVSQFGIGALSNLVSGLMCLGISEALKRLGEISATVRKLADDR